MLKRCSIPFFFIISPALNVFHRYGHAVVASEGWGMSLEVGPIQTSHGAGFLVVELA
jgi:hypothetical protein